MMVRSFLKLYLILFLITTTRGQHDYKPEYKATVSNVFLGEPLDEAFKKVGNKAYHFGQNKVSWYKASLICRSLGGYLASIDNQNDIKDLSSYLTTNYLTGRLWWLSGSDQDSEGDFFWYSTGRRFAYADWSTDQPDNFNEDENCVYLEYRRTSYLMFDGRCDRKMYYVCENILKTIILNLA